MSAVRFAPSPTLQRRGIICAGLGLKQSSAWIRRSCASKRKWGDGNEGEVRQAQPPARRKGFLCPRARSARRRVMVPSVMAHPPGTTGAEPTRRFVGSGQAALPTNLRSLWGTHPQPPPDARQALPAEPCRRVRYAPSPTLRRKIPPAQASDPSALPTDGAALPRKRSSREEEPSLAGFCGFPRRLRKGPRVRGLSIGHVGREKATTRRGEGSGNRAILETEASSDERICLGCLASLRGIIDKRGPLCRVPAGSDFVLFRRFTSLTDLCFHMWRKPMQTLGIRREDKNQWEARVPLNPTDVKTLIEKTGSR